VATVISLPRTEDELSRRIEEHWTTLVKATDPAWIGIVRNAPAIGAALEGYSDEEVFSRVQSLASATKGLDTAIDPRLAEFELLSSGRKLIGENSPRALLHAETLDRVVWDPEGDQTLVGIAALVAVHRLREVACLYGFTRFEPATLANDDLEDVGLAVEGAPLAKSPTWLPAIEQFGEGIFILLDPRSLGMWLARRELRVRGTMLASGVTRWVKSRSQRGARADASDLGERIRPEYILAHGLAHSLMTEVSLDCGYPASALRERIYVPPRKPDDPIRAGLLIYTATAGTQGTLGGLVEVTGRFSRVLHSALERLRLCSGDPICADHDPATADEDRALHGAACHGCLLVAETSCESRNLQLDRALLVDTVGMRGAGYFQLE
jgi:hypothetical protein